MAIRTLSEAQKRLAEMMVKGSPSTAREMAEKLGVARKTLYVWRADPVFQAYHTALSEEVRSQRVSSMAGVNVQAVEAVSCALRNAVAALNAEDGKERVLAPSLTQLVDALRKLADVERVDLGKPSNISKSETVSTKEESPASRAMVEWLDKLAGEVADTSSVTHAPTEPADKGALQ